MQIFLDMVEKHYGKRPIIYVTVDFYRDVMVGAFETYPLWVRSVAGYPTIRYGQRKWAFWQYTATGRAWGIEGPVDRNVFFGTKKQWQEWLIKNRQHGHEHHTHLPVS
jgi:lysozyme